MNCQRRLKYAVLFLLLIYLIGRYWIAEPFSTPCIDYRIYHTYCQQALKGQNPFIKIPGDTTPGYIYPVFSLVIFIPFTYVDVETGESLWRLFNLALVATIVVLAIRLTRRGLPCDLSGRDRQLAGWVVGGIILTFLPNTSAFRQGQCEILVHAFLLLAMWQCHDKRRKIGAFFLSLAILTKAMPVLLIPAFLPLMGLAGLLTTVVVGLGYLLALAALGLFGWEWYLVTERIPQLSEVVEGPSVSFYHELARVFGSDAAARFAAPAEVFILLLYLGGIVWLWRKRAGGIWAVCWGLAVLPLASRFLEYHHLVHITPAYVAIYLLCKRRPAESRGPRNLAVLSFILIDMALFYRNVAFYRIASFLLLSGVLLLAVGTLWGGLSDARGR